MTLHPAPEPVRLCGNPSPVGQKSVEAVQKLLQLTSPTSGTVNGKPWWW